MEFIGSDYSLCTLFLLGFAASTLLPLGSEWLLVILIAEGHSVSETVVVATLGNYLGACTTYGVGRWGSEFLTTKILRISKTDSLKAGGLFQKWGVWSLLFSWLPIIGDPLCLVAGMFRTHFPVFSILVLTGKGLRYFFLAIAAGEAFPK